jgi:hypothetical protein
MLVAFDICWTATNGAITSPSTVRIHFNPESQGVAGQGWTMDHALEAQQAMEYTLGWPTHLYYVRRED